MKTTNAILPPATTECLSERIEKMVKSINLVTLPAIPAKIEAGEAIEQYFKSVAALPEPKEIRDIFFAGIPVIINKNYPIDYYEIQNAKGEVLTSGRFDVRCKESNHNL